MHIQADRRDLHQATARLQGALSDRALAHIELRAAEGTLSLKAADNIMMIHTQIVAEVVANGDLAVPARLFSDVIRELPAGPVQLQSDGTALRIVAGASGQFSMRLPINADHSWSAPEEVPTLSRARITGRKITYGISQVQFCIAEDAARNYGAVALCQRTGPSTFRFVGTDGYRLAMCDLDFGADGLPEGFLAKPICLSKRAMAELNRMASETDGDLELGISTDHTTLIARTDAYYIYARLSSVEFPEYEAVIPKEAGACVTLDRHHLLAVLKRVLLAADRTATVAFEFDAGLLTVKAHNAGTSEGQEQLELSGYDAEALRLVLNGRYLVDALAATASHEVQMRFSSSLTSVTLAPQEEPDACQTLHVLVPVAENL